MSFLGGGGSGWGRLWARVGTSAVGLAVESQLSGEDGASEEAVFLLEVVGLEMGEGASQGEEEPGVFVGTHGEGGCEGPSPAGGCGGGAGEAPPEALAAPLPPFRLACVVGAQAGDEAGPQVRTIGIHQDLPDAKMAGHLPEGLQAPLELLLAVQVGVGEEEGDPPSLLHQALQAGGGAGAAAAVQEQGGAGGGEVRGRRGCSRRRH